MIALALNMASPHPISFFNRRTGRLETEEVYGEAFLRWTYETLPGRWVLWALARRAWFSRFYGWRMSRPGSRNRIRPFIRRYGLNPDEFLEPIDRFRSFNEFFYRKLRADARPIDADPTAVVFPADARHLAFPDVSAIDGVFVKGQRFDLPTLLGDAELARRFEHGTLVLSRLCPVDYHRFHFPAAGVPTRTRLIRGDLTSVNPIALRRNLAGLWENKRMLTYLQCPVLGEVLLLEIGATCVGTIRQTYTPGRLLAKGAEKGYFAFGGSSTIVIFPEGRIRLADDLVAHSAEGRELYAWMGDRLGTIVPG